MSFNSEMKYFSTSGRSLYLRLNQNVKSLNGYPQCTLLLIRHPSPEGIQTLKYRNQIVEVSGVFSRREVLMKHPENIYYPPVVGQVLFILQKPDVRRIKSRDYFDQAAYTFTLNLHPVLRGVSCFG